MQDGIDGNIYEFTAVNNRLSQWNAKTVMVDKIENFIPADEPRVTFDYSGVNEN